MTLSLNHLTETEFESFCFDLLKSLDFVNLSWRKGTGLSSSPSDQGRDIQGQRLIKEVDGSEHHEKWFVECKHYVKGVPSEKIQGALAWAHAERPNVLLIIVSNFLSNSAKNYIENLTNNSKPPFRIKVWELKDLEKLSAGKNELLRKYRLPSEIPFLSELNSYHILYAVKPQLNTIKYFIELMDSLDSVKRDKAFQMTYLEIINPRFREPVTGKETLKELRIDETDYMAFRKKCLSLGDAERTLTVYHIVTSALCWLFNYADRSSLLTMQNRQLKLIERLKTDINTTVDEDKRKKLEDMIETPQRAYRELPLQVEFYYEVYTYICEELVRKLLVERSIFS